MDKMYFVQTADKYTAGQLEKEGLIQFSFENGIYTYCMPDCKNFMADNGIDLSKCVKTRKIIL